MKIEDKYTDGTYLRNSGAWHREDSEWKAMLVQSILKVNNIEHGAICELGCGSGDVLRYLRKLFPFEKLYGYDISPQVTQFWVVPMNSRGDDIAFQLGDFHSINNIYYDVLLMLDVFEHVRDPFSFLEESHAHAKNFVFHIPLDLSALAVARKMPLLHARRTVGHLHSYTKDLAIETLTDCGYKIIDWRYTGAFSNSPNRSWKTRLASVPRRLLCALDKDLGVRILGGETLLILAE